MNKKKIVILIMLIMTLNMLVANFQYASSVTVGNSYKIKYDKNEYRYIKYNNVSQRFWDYYYIDDDNTKSEAYCINLSQKGAEHVEGGYDVKTVGKIADEGIVNIINNGYPNKSYGELGLGDRNQAKFATQFAIWIYTNNLDISKIVELNTEGEAVKKAILNIYNSRNTKVDLDTSFSLDEGERQIITIEDKSYYKVNFKINKGKDVLNIKYLNNIKDMRLVDKELNVIENFDSTYEFYALYPVEKVNKNESLKMEFEIKIKSQGALYGKPDDSTLQDVALILPEYEIKSESIPVNFEYQILEFEVIKTDNFKNLLDGVKFEVFNVKTGESLGEFVTDKNGRIFIDFRKELNINNEIEIGIKEKETKSGYILSDKITTIKLECGKCVKVSLENVKKEIKEEVKIEEKKIELPKTGM